MQMFLSLFISMMIARYLGPTNYGVINYAASFVAFFTSIASLGLDGIIVNELVKNEGKDNDIIGSCICMRFIAGVISVFCICVLVGFLNPGDKILLAVAFLQSLSLPVKAFECINFWYQSKLESKYIVISQIIGYLVVSIYKIYILYAGKGVVWFAASVMIEALVIAVIMLFSYVKRNGFKFSFDKYRSKQMLSNSIYFMMAGIMTTVYNQIDRVMIGNMIDKKSVGLYTAAVTISSVWSFVPIAVIESIRPIVMKEKSINENNYKNKFQQLITIVLWLSLAFSLVTIIFGEYIIMILYGNDYKDAINALYFYALGMVFPYIGNVRSLWLICENKHKYVQVFSIIGAIVNIILNLLLINCLGMYGAALATSITQIVVSIIVPMCFKDTRPYVFQLLKAFRISSLFSTIKHIIKV